MFPELNAKILEQAKAVKYQVADLAPSNEVDLFNQPNTLVVWAGASDNTIFGSASVNWAFRALHDQLHRKSGLSFSIDHEVELGRIQASKFDGILADIVYLEVAGQALFYKQNGIFVPNQVAWTLEQLRKMR